MMPPLIYHGWRLTFKWDYDPIEDEYHYAVRCKKDNVSLDIKGSWQDPSGAVVMDQIIAEINKFEKGGAKKQDGHE